ncbi:MAG: hypothetical protein ABI693_24270, partial [Bryobacteraceae bacterium]
ERDDSCLFADGGWRDEPGPYHNYSSCFRGPRYTIRFPNRHCGYFGLVGPFFAQIQTGPNGQTMDYGTSLGLNGANFQAFILLHELGHLMGVYGENDDDGANQAHQDANNALILKDCFKKASVSNP